MMKAVLIIAVLIFSTSSATAQWRMWGTFAGEKTYYQRLVRERSIVTVWTKKGRLLSHLSFDCSAEKVRYLIVIQRENLLDPDETWNTPTSKYGKWLYKKACP